MGNPRVAAGCFAKENISFNSSVANFETNIHKIVSAIKLFEPEPFLVLTGL